MIAVFDTNIVIDYLKGIVEARIEWAKHTQKTISIVTYIEVLAYNNNTNLEQDTRKRMKNNLEIIQLTPEITEKTIEIRKTKKLKLPDAIILATAMVNNALLVTRDSNFDSEMPIIRVPYKI